MKKVIKLIPLIPKKDNRGVLAEVSSAIPNKSKHLFIATIKPGFSRGNHYHKRKTEWVLVTQGEVEVSLTDIKSGEVNIVKLNETELKLLEIEPNLSVKIANNSKHLATILAIFDEVFDSQDPDVWTIKN